MSKQFIKLQGTITVERNRVSIDFHGDLVNYYLWHIKKATWNTIKLSTPRYGAHVSVIIPTIHGEYIQNKDLRKELVRWNKKKVDVFMDPTDVRIGGHSKGFINYWIPIKCNEVQRMKDLLFIKETNYHGDHLTIASNKSDVKQNKKG